MSSHLTGVCDRVFFGDLGCHMKQQSALERDRSESSLSGPMVVLVADSDAGTRARYREALVQAGCDVVEASDGRDALAKAFAESPSLVITELSLPFVNGYALCDILRRDPVTAAIPILVVAAEASQDRADRVERLGVDGVLLKPTTPARIVDEARRVLASPRDGPVGVRARGTDEQRQPSDQRRAPLSRGVSHTKAHFRFTTTSPAKSPPALSCPSCDRALKYEQSHIGGVSDRHPEQWDYFVCAGGCGVFQYRQRTRKVRHVD